MKSQPVFMERWWPRIYKQGSAYVIDLRCRSTVIAGAALIITGVLGLVGVI